MGGRSFVGKPTIHFPSLGETKHLSEAKMRSASTGRKGDSNLSLHPNPILQDGTSNRTDQRLVGSNAERREGNLVSLEKCHGNKKKEWQHVAHQDPIWILEDCGGNPSAIHLTRNRDKVLVGFEGGDTAIRSYATDDGTSGMSWSMEGEEDIRAIFEDSRGSIWACTGSLKLARWTWDRKQPQQVITLCYESRSLRNVEEVVPREQAKRFMPWELEERAIVRLTVTHTVEVSIEGELVRKRPKPLPSWVAEFSDDGTQLVCGTPGNDDPRILIFPFPSSFPERVLEGHTSGILSLARHPFDRNILFSGSYDATIRKWSLETGDCLKVFRGHTGGVRCIKIEPEATIMYSGSHDHTLKMWDLQMEVCLRSFQGGHPSPVLGIALLSTGDFLYSCGGGALGGAAIMLWETKGLRYTDSGRFILSWMQVNPHKAGAVTVMKVTEEDPDILLVGASDGSFACWKVTRRMIPKEGGFRKGFFAR